MSKGRNSSELGKLCLTYICACDACESPCQWNLTACWDTFETGPNQMRASMNLHISCQTCVYHHQHNMVQLGTNITIGYQVYTIHGIGRNDDDNGVDIHEDDQNSKVQYSGIGGSG